MHDMPASGHPAAFLCGPVREFGFSATVSAGQRVGRRGCWVRHLLDIGRSCFSWTAAAPAGNKEAAWLSASCRCCSCAAVAQCVAMSRNEPRGCEHFEGSCPSALRCQRAPRSVLESRSLQHATSCHSAPRAACTSARAPQARAWTAGPDPRTPAAWELAADAHELLATPGPNSCMIAVCKLFWSAVKEGFFFCLVSVMSGHSRGRRAP